MKTRNSWLNHMVEALRPLFAEAGVRIPEGVRATSGYELPPEDSTIRYEVLILTESPDPIEVAGTLVHELVHTVVGLGDRHGCEFRALARRLGLVDYSLGTVAVGDRLRLRLIDVIKEVGVYPSKWTVLNFFGF